MIKIENIDVWGFEHAVRGMRNPMNSRDKSDSEFKIVCVDPYSLGGKYVIGEHDLALMQKLYKAGTEHRKYLRQIFVSMDITAPLYWWKQADQFKIGTTTNSTSTMHTIHKAGIDYDMFSLDCICELSEFDQEIVDEYIHMLERLRVTCKTGDGKWRALIQLLPESFNQKRTLTMSYENVVNMIKQRENHKLNEWREFTDILKRLPYIKEITE